MTYYIFKLEYSQTDSDMVIVQANSRSEAEAYLKRNGENGPRYVSFYGGVDSIIKVKN
jgi:hypothetical protein